MIARVIGERLTRAFSETVVVDNKPGAIGTIGLYALVRAKPDGYTLGLMSMPFIIAPSVLPQVPYDTEKDLEPVTLVNWSYSLFVVPAASSARSLRDLIALAKARPGMLRYSSAGNATPAHLAGELFKRETGLLITHIPYKGNAYIYAVLAGEADLTFGSTAAVSPHIKTGKLRAFVTPAPMRLAQYPNLPTLAELGYPGVVISD